MNGTSKPVDKGAATDSKRRPGFSGGRSIRLGLVIPGVIASLALASCSSGTKSSSSETSGSGSTTATLSSVKIGFIGPLTGAVAYPDRLASAKAAIRGINSRGGLNGHPMTLDSCDDKNTIDDASACARQMVSDNVAAVVGSTAINDQVVTPILAAAKIPQIGTAGRTSVTLNSPDNYEPGANATSGYAVLAAYGAKKLDGPVSLVSFDVPAASQFRGVVTGMVDPAGIKFVSTVLVSATQADYGPIVVSANRNDAKSALMLLPVTALTQFVKADSGSKSLTYLSPILYQSTDAASLGGTSQLDRVVAFSLLPIAVPSSTNPAVKQYISDMAAEESSGDSNAALAKQTQGIGPWFSFFALDQVVKQQKTTDFSSAGLTSSLNAAKDVDMQGLIPAWTPNAVGPTGESRVTNSTYYLVGYKGGQPYLITPTGISSSDALAGKF